MPTKKQAFYTFNEAYSRAAHFDTFQLMELYDSVTSMLQAPTCMVTKSLQKAYQLLESAVEIQSIRDRVTNSVHMGYGMKLKLDEQHRARVKQARRKNGEPTSSDEDSSDEE